MRNSSRKFYLAFAKLIIIVNNYIDLEKTCRTSIIPNLLREVSVIVIFHNSIRI